MKYFNIFLYSFSFLNIFCILLNCSTRCDWFFITSGCSLIHLVRLCWSFFIILYISVLWMIPFWIWLRLTVLFLKEGMVFNLFKACRINFLELYSLIANWVSCAFRLSINFLFSIDLLVVTICCCNSRLLNANIYVSNLCCLFAKFSVIRESVMLALSRRAFKYARFISVWKNSQIVKNPV